MSLKQAIMVKSEFTNKNVHHMRADGTEKSHGKSPSRYVMEYMGRKGATETLTPVRYDDTQSFIERYMARDKAVDVAIPYSGQMRSKEAIDAVKKDMYKIQKQGGVAFGYGEYSLSHKKLRAAAKDIQAQYDKGKTVMKTVISFSREYLYQNGIITEELYTMYDGMDEDDIPGGIYRGRIDQLKLRMAIMNGLDRLGHHYDDLQYIGVIQVDTNNVHCHLAMVDRGIGTLASDGTQKGKISRAGIKDIKRGIDMFLDQSQSVKMMVSNVDYDKRNTLCFIKKYTHKVMSERGFSQFLLSCLPEDRNLWRASTHREEMQKPNSIVREYVMGLLQLEDSGYQEALEKVDVYARTRMRNEGLSGKEYRTLYNAGKKAIIDESINSVYAVLKQIPESDLIMRTPMLDNMSLPFDEMAAQADGSNPMVEFGFKLRSYKSRLDHHKQEFHKYHNAVKEYEELERQGQATADSHVYYEYLKVEEEYNEMLLSKYNHFLRFLPPDEDYMQEFDRLMTLDRRIQNLTLMQDDQSIRRMTPDNAEDYGIQVYGESGGDTIVSNPAVINGLITRLKADYESGMDQFSGKLADYGLSLSTDKKLRRETKYNFEEVKSLDLHHLLYDFPYDIQLSDESAKAFVDMADERYNAFQRAKQYFIQSGQEERLSEFPETDIELQHSTADRFRGDTTLHTQREEISVERKTARRAARTVRIDYDFYVHQEEEIKNMIKNTINSLQYE